VNDHLLSACNIRKWSKQFGTQAFIVQKNGRNRVWVNAKGFVGF
jgi:hypothetical protein